MKIKSPCKINLMLKILDKREDGYHNLETIFYPLDYPYDILDVELLDVELANDKQAQDLILSCNIDDIDLNDNTLTRAYQLYVKYTGFAPKLKIDLEKNIPHGAGLGGGSANAAKLLLFLQDHNPTPLNREELINLGAKIGADVPFFLFDYPCRARGIGEILQEEKINLNNFYLLLIDPYIKISTKLAFKEFDLYKKNLTEHKTLDKYQSVLFQQKINCENDFEQVIFSLYPKLGDIKKKLLEYNAEIALLSGSGSCLFAIFSNKAKAEHAKTRMIEFFGEDYFKIYSPLKLK